MIHEMLGTGRNQPTSAKDICDRLGITRQRLSNLVKAERRDGWPICSNTYEPNNGYYLAATAEEMENFCARLRHRAGEIFKTRRACLKTIAYLPPEDAVDYE